MQQYIIQSQIRTLIDVLFADDGRNVFMHKVPAHANCFGNNMADQLAKAGRMMKKEENLEVEFISVD
jgi:ribonuclease HI